MTTPADANVAASAHAQVGPCETLPTHLELASFPIGPWRAILAARWTSVQNFDRHAVMWPDDLPDHRAPLLGFPLLSFFPSMPGGGHWMLYLYESTRPACLHPMSERLAPDTYWCVTCGAKAVLLPSGELDWELPGAP